MSNICKKALVLNLKLLTKHAILYLSTDPQAKVKMKLKLSLINLRLKNLVQKNPSLVMAIGDLNAKSSSWFFQNKISLARDVIENLKPQFGLYHLINQPNFKKTRRFMYQSNLDITAKIDH